MKSGRLTAARLWREWIKGGAVEGGGKGGEEGDFLRLRHEEGQLPNGSAKTRDEKQTCSYAFSLLGKGFVPMWITRKRKQTIVRILLCGSVIAVDEKKGVKDVFFPLWIKKGQTGP